MAFMAAMHRRSKGYDLKHLSVGAIGIVEPDSVDQASNIKH